MSDDHHPDEIFRVYGVKAQQVWERKADGRRLEVIYTIFPEARVRYLDSGRKPYIHLKHFASNYRLVD
jgi:hypothetical protein